MLISSSSRYSIYKVQWSVLRSRSNFYILPRLQSFVKNFFKVFWFSLVCVMFAVWQLFNFNTPKIICQEVFFVLFQTFWTAFFNFLAAVSNFYMLPHRIAFVKNFFHFFSNFVFWVFFYCPRGQLRYISTCLTICQAPN